MAHDAVRFRNALIADVDAVVALVERAYRGDASRAGWTTEADLLEDRRTNHDEIRSIVTGAASRMRLMERGSDLVACVRVEATPTHGYIGMVTVEPTLQAAGLGRLLLAEAERVISQEFGLAVGRMTVIAQRDELIVWYERRGWARTGATAPFPYDDPRKGAPKRPDLYFVVLEKRLIG